MPNRAAREFLKFGVAIEEEFTCDLEQLMNQPAPKLYDLFMADETHAIMQKKSPDDLASVRLVPVAFKDLGNTANVDTAEDMREHMPEHPAAAEALDSPRRSMTSHRLGRMVSAGVGGMALA